MKRFVKLLLLAGLFYQTVNAQGLSDYVRLGDRAYNEGEYYAASQYYKKVLDDLTADSSFTVYPYRAKSSTIKARFFKEYSSVIFKLANSYRLHYDYVQAEEWYFKALAFDNKDFPQTRFWYASMLQANHKYKEALKQFMLFKETYFGTDEFSERVIKEIENCKFAIYELDNPETINLVKLDTQINLAGSNYGSNFLDNDRTILFTSSRPQFKKRNKEEYINAIYMSNKDSIGVWSEPYLAEIPSENEMHQGATSLPLDNDRVYFTRWKGKKRNKESEIFMSRMVDGKWSDPIKLNNNVNGNNIKALHPYYSKSENRIYFSSDKRGGLGKSDIWYAELDTEGQPGTPVNFTEVNTTDDEQTPYYNERTNTFYFSSNGRLNLGGFDIFRIRKKSSGEWGEVLNMGYPYNSGEDDVYYMHGFDPYIVGYFSSDRSSICCLEIYSFTRLFLAIEGTVIDADHGLPIPGAAVSLLDSATLTPIDRTLTDSNGYYFFDIDAKKAYKVLAEKKSYISNKIEFSMTHQTKSDTVMQKPIKLKKFEIGQPIVIKDIFYDFDKATLRPVSMIVLDSLARVLELNPFLEIEISSHTDSKGTDEYNLELSAARAKSVVDYLVSKGINPELLNSRGYGEVFPIAPNILPNGSDNPEGRQLNRRTEFRIRRILSGS